MKQNFSLFLGRLGIHLTAGVHLTRGGAETLREEVGVGELRAAACWGLPHAPRPDWRLAFG